jgi:hypothetical protein
LLNQAARLFIKYELLLVKKKDRVMPPERKITRDNWMAMRRTPKGTKLLWLMLDQRRLVDCLHGPALIQALSQYVGPADLNRHA